MICNTEQEFPLNNPETLEQMRQQLISLVHQDQQTLQNTLREYQTYFNQNYQSSTDHYEQDPSSILIPFDFLKETQFNLKQKSSCVNTLAQLAVRLIDCILEEQQSNFSILQQYEHQVEVLKEQIECLSSKNQYIQNDAEYFKQHLREVETQLEQMVNEQEANDVAQQNEEQYTLKDRQIDILQQELQRIKNELQFYKFSTRSKKSGVQLKDHLLISIRSQNTLLSSSKMPSLANLNQTDLQNTVQKLKNENQNLKRELQLSRRSRVSNRISNQIKQEEFEQTQRMPYQFNQCRQSIKQVSSIRLFQKGILHDFKEYLESPRSKLEEDYNFTPAPPLQNVQESHALNHEWSAKSFELVSDIKPAQLIYLNQQEEQLPCERDQLNTGNKTIQQTRETEGSVRQIQLGTTSKVEKQTNTVGVNTEFNYLLSFAQKKEGEEKKPSFIQKLKQINFPIVKQLTNFFIRNRIRRNIYKANQSMLLINS